VKTGGGATSTRYWSDRARLDPTFKGSKGEAISEAKEELVRRHFEEIFSEDGDMRRRVLPGVWSIICDLESRREEYRCRR
jgi:hypothetical protein